MKQMVVSLDQFASELELDPENPGLHDPEYVARRTYFFHLARDYRLGNHPFPDIPYEEHEHDIWRVVWPRLQQVHADWACQTYLEGKAILNMSADRIPRLVEMNRRLSQETGIGLVPAEGLMAYREFFAFLAQKKIPCTMYLRHGSQPEYATEPDLVHDVIGHFPMLTNKAYVDFISMIGRASQKCPDQERLLAFNRLYFWTIEFGLIEEGTDIKVFGAGMLSSWGEMQHCYSSDVKWLDLDMQDLINRPYDPYNMQNVFYVIPSFEVLVEETRKLIRSLGIDPE